MGSQQSSDQGFVDRETRRIAWRATGDGAPLMLINGYGGTAADWDPRLLELLGQSFRVVCCDPRGLGASERGDPSEALTIDSMAADAEALCEALGLDQLVVAGWSMGGFVAQRLALRLPGRVVGLVLAATDPGGPGALRADPQVWARLTDVSGTPRQQATRLLGLLFPAELAARLDGEVGEVVAQARAALDPTALRAQEAAMEQWHSEPQPAPGPGSPPTLVACGAEDIVIPPANSDLLAERWQAGRPHRFEGCGHAFMAQMPDRFAALVAGAFGSAG